MKSNVDLVIMGTCTCVRTNMHTRTCAYSSRTNLEIYIDILFANNFAGINMELFMKYWASDITGHLISSVLI